MRLSTPRSRRNTMLYASAVNVVDITLIAAIAGTRRLSWCWLPARMMPPPSRNSSGSRKLKNAALGLRQNMRRSSRYWRQVSASVSLIGGELQIGVLERRPRDAQLRQALAARERLGGERVQHGRRIVGLALDELAASVAVGD